MDNIEIFNALRSTRIFIFTIFCCTLSSVTWAQSLIVSSGSANNFLITYPANVITTPPSGMMVTFKSNQASLGGVCNLNMNSTGNFPIRKFITQNLAAGDIQTGHFVTVIFDGAVWHMISNGSQPLATASQWTTSGVNIYYNGGNIGIGTSIPGQALVVIGNSSATGIGYLGTIIGNNLTGAAGSIVTVDGFGKLGLGTLTGGGGLTGAGQANGLAYYTAASTLASNVNSLSWNGTIMSISGIRLYAFKSGLNSNIAIGNDVANTGFTGADNNIFGYQAAYSITAGNRNNIMGCQAGNGITIGTSNNIFGYQAGYLNLGGNYNNFLGYQAGYTNTTNGQYNNFLGYTAGYYNTTGVANNYLGDNAGGSYSTGSWNNMIGYQAGFYGGNSTNTGSYNNFFGYNAGSTNVSGSNNIAIGYQADMSTAGLSNAVSIGSYAVAGANYVMALGGTGANAVKVGIGTGLPNQSLSVIGSSSITGVGFFGTIIGNNLAGSPGFVVTVDGAGKLGIGTNGPLGPAGGDLINNYPGPTVAKIQGYSVSATAPSNGQILYYNGANWLPGAVGGDLSGSYPALSVIKLQGYSVSATAPAAGQMLYYSTGWQPGSPGGDLSGSYPSPTIAAGAVTSAKIAASAVNLTSQVTGILPVANGGTGTSTAYTSGWVLFAGASGVHSASSSLFWNNSSNRLGIGTSIPLNSLDVSGGVAIGTFAAANTAPTNGLIVSGNLGIGVPAPGFSLDVAGAAVIGGSNANLGSASLTYLQNSAKLLVGWNKSAGSGETDFIGNRGAGTNGGFRFYDYTNAGVLSQLGLIDPTGPVFFGYLAGNVNTAVSNTGFGYQALSLNTSGNQNSAFGFEALMNNTGLNNTAHGFFALLGNTTGNYNTASGQGSCQNSSTGSYNTAYGSNALYNVGAGSYNTAVGQAAQQSNNGGGNNTSVGFQALYNVSTGTSNTSIGYSADIATGTFTNATAIGAISSVSASNKVRIGNTSITVVEGQVAYTYPSDARFKENVKEDIKGLDFIMKLRPVSYNFNRLSMAKHIKEKTEGRETELQELYKSRSTGFLAQEIEQLIKDTHFDAFDAVHSPTNEHDNYSLSYSHFVVPLVKAVQEQQFIIDSLTNQITQLKTSIDLIGSFNKEALQKLTLNNEDGKSKTILLVQYIYKLELQMTKLSTENAGLKNEIEDIKKHLGIGIVSKK